MGLRRSERQVEYRTEVVFELAGTRAVDAPVRGVVRTHGQLVDQQTAVAGLEQLDGQDPDDVQLGGDGRARRCASTANLPGRLGAGATTSTDSVPLNGLDDRIGDGLP